MHAIKRMALLGCAIAALAVPATADATITTKTIDYGPYTISAGNRDPHDLNGTRATISEGPMLHHAMGIMIAYFG